MATNDEIRLAYQRHWDAVYAEELEHDECPNGAPVTDMAHQRTMAELGCTWEQIEDATWDGDPQELAALRLRFK